MEMPIRDENTSAGDDTIITDDEISMILAEAQKLINEFNDGNN